MQSESIFISVNARDRLHIKRFYSPGHLGSAVVMLHGAITHGGMFYSKSGKGLAPYLAGQGYDVYVLDMRGRGESIPLINKHTDYGHLETICEDIFAVMQKIVENRGEVPQHWVTYSWGGILMAAHLARFPKSCKHVQSIVCLASKRRISVMNKDKFLGINLAWNIMSRLLIKIFGYLPIKQLGLGMDNESRKSHRQIMRWVKEHEWIDPDDGFDYGRAIQTVPVPPTLYLAGAADTYLGHPKDVRNFMEEVGAAVSEYRLLGIHCGNKADYDHTSILTHPEAANDHFPLILEWIKKYDCKSHE